MTYVALSRGVSIDRMRVTGFSLSGVKTNAKWCARVLIDVQSGGVLYGNQSREALCAVPTREIHSGDQERKCNAIEGRCAVDVRRQAGTVQEESIHYTACGESIGLPAQGDCIPQCRDEVVASSKCNDAILTQRSVKAIASSTYHDEVHTQFSDETIASPQNSETHAFLKCIQRNPKTTSCTNATTHSKRASKELPSQPRDGSPAVQQLLFACLLQQREDGYNYRLLSLLVKSALASAETGLGLVPEGSISCPLALTPIS